MRSSVADPVARVHEAVRAALLEGRPLPRCGWRVVAVSGGADSTCLLDALAAVVGPARLVAVHVDHGFRPESARDGEAVTALARRLGVAYEVIRVDGPGFVSEHHVGIEQSGRILRYRALAEAAERHGATVVATGHTRDDSVESLLMHLLRGSGLDGLTGIRSHETLDVTALGPSAVGGGQPATTASLLVTRPLLRVGRAETAEYCLARGLRWVVDPTNDDPRHLRNRVRHHLLPVLRTYNPSIDAVLERTARLLADEREWIEREVARRWRRIARAADDGAAAMDAGRLSRQPKAVRRRLARRAVAQVGAGSETLTFDAVERILAVVASDEPGRTRLGGGVVAERVGELVEIRREGAERR